MSKHLSRARLQQWIEGQLSGPESTVVEAHLEDCDECASMFADFDSKDDPFVARVRDVLDADLKIPDDVSTRLDGPGVAKIGDTIGPYKLLQQLGEGGMGSVWMAHQERPVDRMVAIKIIKAGMDTKEVIARFETERQALAMMDHPNIASVLDAGTTDAGRPYFVMELVKGLPITQFCDQTRMPAERRLQLFCDICEAVQHAHRKGIIHRDIKPSNILVTIDDRTPHAKIIDFGLAKATGARLTEKTLFTALGQMVGTPAYMSPEQAEMSGLDVDTRTDVYSLGVLLYEMLTSATPLDVARIQEAGYAEIQRMIREEEPPSPSTKISSLDDDSSTVADKRATQPRDLVQLLRGDLDVIVMKALEKDRGRRYESPHDFADDIRRYLRHEPIEARPASVAYRLTRLYQRNKGVVVAASLIFASMLIGTVVSFALAVKATQAESVARQRLGEVVKEQQKTQQALANVQVERDRAVAAEKLVEREHAELLAEQTKTKAALTASEAARSEAQAVTKMLVEVFRSPDPKRDGATITVVEILDRIVTKFEDDSQVDANRLANLRAIVGDTYHALGSFEKAVKQRRAVVAHWKQQGKSLEDFSLRSASISLANSLDRMGQNDESRQLNERLLDDAVKRFGHRHRETLVLRNNLANNFSRDQREDKLAFQQETARLAVEVLGEHSADTLLFQSNLADTLATCGKDKEALDLSKEVLEKRREKFGAEHPDTLTSIRVLLECYRKADMIQEQVPLAEENLLISKKLLGEQHDYTQRAMARFSSALAGVGRSDEAIAMRKRLLELRRKLLGNVSEKTLQTVRQMILAYALLGDVKAAIKLGRDSIEELTTKFGPDDNRVLLLNNITAFAVGLNPGASREDIELAIECATHAVESKPKMAAYWNTRASVRYRTGEWEQAIKDAEESIDLSDGDQSDRYLIAMSQWQLDRKEDARRSLDEANQWLMDHPTNNRAIFVFRDEARSLIKEE